ncbi:MAG: hypothetical protein C5B49_13740 [Bdellovibrio sp.]|nr:MAG: hypothetical protein C5B49_13740 [Bdellovibrio sp.]
MRVEVRIKNHRSCVLDQGPEIDEYWTMMNEIREIAKCTKLAKFAKLTQVGAYATSGFDASAVPIRACVFVAGFFAATISLPCAGAARLQDLKPAMKVGNFAVRHLLLDADQQVLGAEFFHRQSGAQVFVLQYESVPQVFQWVDTPPFDDRGLPHSLEHLLAGKGSTGRSSYLLENMLLGIEANATFYDYTMYPLLSRSGLDNFFRLFSAKLRALLAPDFSDAEAEREFYHFAVQRDPNGKLSLIEKGSVYNEMVNTNHRHDHFFAIYRMVLGEKNPLGYSWGGDPNAMRTGESAKIVFSQVICRASASPT